MQLITLRGDQVTFKSGIYNSWGEGNRNVCGVANTGFGKSVVMADIVNDHQQQNLHSAVIAHRNELVTQMSEHVANRGIPHRIIGSDKTVALAIKKHRKKFGRSFINPSATTAVSSVDTLIARQDSLKDWSRQISLWCTDECHHLIGNWYTDEHGNPKYTDKKEIDWRTEANKWGKAVSMFNNARGLGVTATPSRADGQGLGWDFDGVFHDMVIGPSMRWLIENNNLSDFEIVCPTEDLREIEEEKTSKEGDWTHQKMRKVVKASGGKIVGNVVENYIKYAYMRKAIVFATDVETAQEIADRFNESGIRAACVHGKSADAWREQSLELFATGEIRVLVNVDLFDEGFDCPNAEVCIMARPTTSLGKYLQMVGRVLRWVAGKVALIIDHVSNVIRHGLPDKERIWSLGRREKNAKHKKDPEELELTRCKSCTKPYEKFRVSCPYCGFEKPLPEPRSRSVEMVDGDLILLDRETLERMRQATQIESPADIAARVTAAAGALAGKGAANRQIEKIAAHRELQDVIAQWAGYERAKGYSDSEIYRRFYLTLGVDVAGALRADQTRSEIMQTTDIVRGWYERISGI